MLSSMHCCSLDKKTLAGRERHQIHRPPPSRPFIFHKETLSANSVWMLLEAILTAAPTRVMTLHPATPRWRNHSMVLISSLISQHEKLSSDIDVLKNVCVVPGVNKNETIFSQQS